MNNLTYVLALSILTGMSGNLKAVTGVELSALNPTFVSGEPLAFILTISNADNHDDVEVDLGSNRIGNLSFTINGKPFGVVEGKRTGGITPPPIVRISSNSTYRQLVIISDVKPTLDGTFAVTCNIKKSRLQALTKVTIVPSEAIAQFVTHAPVVNAIIDEWGNDSQELHDYLVALLQSNPKFLNNIDELEAAGIIDKSFKQRIRQSVTNGSLIID